MKWGKIDNGNQGVCISRQENPEERVKESEKMNVLKKEKQTAEETKMQKMELN